MNHKEYYFELLESNSHIADLVRVSLTGSISRGLRGVYGALISPGIPVFSKPDRGNPYIEIHAHNASPGVVADYPGCHCLRLPLMFTITAITAITVIVTARRKSRSRRFRVPVARRTVTSR